MYHLLLNNAMYMCCMFLMIGSINLMVFVNQIHCALCDAATEFLCVIYVNFKLQHFTQAVTGREVWRKIRKALALEWTKLPYNSHHLLPASYHTNLGLIPGESIQDLWCTKCPGTDSSTVVRFPHQYHSTTTYLHLRTITTRNTTGQTLETFWKKKQRSFRCLETTDRKVFWFPPPDFQSYCKTGSSSCSACTCTRTSPTNILCTACEHNMAWDCKLL